MQKSIIINALFFIHLITLVLSSQSEIQFKHLSVEHGLSQSSVHAILQDSRGFLWFATEDGLNRFDGYELKVYRHIPSDKLSLSNDFILGICEGDSGDIWIGTRGGGINRFIRKTETFVHYLPDSSDPYSFGDVSVWEVFYDSKGQLWAGTNNAGLQLYIPEINGFKQFLPDTTNSHSISDISVGIIFEDRSGNIWVGTEEGGLNLIDPINYTFTTFCHDPDDPNSISDNNVIALSETAYQADSILWIGTVSGGLNEFNRVTKQFKVYKHNPQKDSSISHNHVRFIGGIDAKNLWIGTYGGGLNIFNLDRKTFTHLKHTAQDPQSLCNDFLVSYYKDQAGVFWFGSRYDGLSSYNPFQSGIQTYTKNSGKNIRLDDDNVWAVYEDPDEKHLWIGSRNIGLSRINLINGEKNKFQYDKKSINSLSSNHITGIFRTADQNLWVGTSAGLNLLDEKSGNVKRIFKQLDDPYSLSHNYISEYCETNIAGERILWLGTRGGGLNAFNRDSERFFYYRNNPTLDNSVELDYILALSAEVNDSSAYLWVGTYGGGLTKFDLTSKKYLKVYDSKLFESNGLSNNYITDIHRDNNGILWIATTSGVDCFDPKTEVFSPLVTSNGSFNESVCNIAEGEAETLWFATVTGQFRYQKRSKSIRKFDVANNLENIEYTLNPLAYHTGKSGRLYFGSLKGLTVVEPEILSRNSLPPTPLITEFRIFNQPLLIKTASLQKLTPNGNYLPQSISGADSLTLGTHQNNITIKYVALRVSDPAGCQYIYRLDGLDENWVEAGSQRLASYTNLDPGNYIFRVKAANRDGVWSNKEASLKILILTPWWRTSWAYALYVILTLGSFYSLHRYEQNRQRLKRDLEVEHKEAEKLKDLDQIKSRFFTNISHEFRTPLSLIKGPIERWMSQIDKPDMLREIKIALKNTDQLLYLINQLLDLSRLDAGMLRLKAAPLNIIELTRQLTMAFESWAFRKQIQLSFEASTNLITAYLDRDKYGIIINNILSNALKFTPKGGKVSVTVKSEERSARNPKAEPSGVATRRFVSIWISDNGPGIPEDKLKLIFDRFYQVDDSSNRSAGGTGIGLPVTKELVELHCGEVKVESQIDIGTVFKIKLPLGKTHLIPEQITDNPPPVNNVLDSTEIKEVEAGKELHSQSVVEASDPSVVGQTHNFKRLLVVEDNLDMRCFICERLKDTYLILEAEDGARGWKLAKENIPDLIISDVMMPEMGGFELCEKLKTDERTSHIPVILLTARASSKSKITGLETGADDYLIKPFDSKELQTRVKNLIEQRLRLKQRFQQQMRLEPSRIEITSENARFLQQAVAGVEEHISESGFTARELSKQMAISKGHLNRKIGELTGLTTTLFIRSIRLKRAAQLIIKKSGNMAQIAYEVGFNNPAFFSQCFKEQFGMTPSEYTRKNSKD